MCLGCTAGGKIAWSFIIGTICIAFSITIGVTWPDLTTDLIQSQFKLTKYTTMYKNWEERPIPLFMEVYLFNWSNVDRVENWKDEKPHFTEVGPFVFEESARRVDLEYSEDDTVIDFNQEKIWKFRPDLSKNDLSDRIYNVNPIAATISWGVRILPKSPIISEVVNAFLDQFSSFSIGKTANEWLFEGFNEGVLDWLFETLESGELPPGIVPDIPYDKFGWFYGRNGSKETEGRYSMYTGKDDIKKLGMLRAWNGNDTVPGLRGECAKVRGTTGELWPPIGKNDDATIFVPDACRSLTFKRSGDWKQHGIKGYKWIADDSLFDNGEKYPEAACWCGEKEEEDCPALAPGVYNVSLCNFGAPAFMSFPHFYLADKSYLDAVDGLSPNRETHESHIAIEPTFGIPLSVEAKLQVNLFLRRDESLEWFKNVPDLYVPMFWFKQVADLPEDLAEKVSLLFVVKDSGMWLCYILAAVGSLFIISGAVFIFLARRSSTAQKI